MIICKKCVLPETFPGITFNEEGICNHCLNFNREKLAEQKDKYRAKFESLLQKHLQALEKLEAGAPKQAFEKVGAIHELPYQSGTRRFATRGDHDCLMCYSGGKDSSYTLYILKTNYNARILAMTMDNGFVSPRAVQNIRNVVESLGIDHYFVKPRFDVLKKIFIACSSENLYPKKTLERASTICTSCMGLVKFISLQLAIEKGIPFIIYGWSPGQAPIASSVFKTNPAMIKSMQSALKGPMSNIVGNAINSYFLEDRHFSDPDRFPYIINPLAFLDYDEGKIFSKIGELGWKTPEDTDANSTNCLLNSYANTLHIKQFGYHPYAYEIANLVRVGAMHRSEGLKRLSNEGSDVTIAYVRRRLNETS